MNLAFGERALGGSAAQRIELELRRAIVALELPPGARLSEEDDRRAARRFAPAGARSPDRAGQDAAGRGDAAARHASSPRSRSPRWRRRASCARRSRRRSCAAPPKRSTRGRGFASTTSSICRRRSRAAATMPPSSATTSIPHGALRGRRLSARMAGDRGHQGAHGPRLPADAARPLRHAAARRPAPGDHGGNRRARRGALPTAPCASISRRSCAPSPRRAENAELFE